MLRFRFPIVIIDEDFRSENTSGLGIRALAEAIEKEGFEVLGVTSYGDLSQFAQQQSRASAFILSIDDEEFTPGPELDPAVLNLRKFIEEIRFKNADIPIYLYGETRTSQHIPNDILRELHGFIHMFEDTPEFVARHIIREAKSYLDGLAPPFFKALIDYAQDGSLLLALPGPLRRRGLPEEPGRPDVPPVLRREHAARRRLQRGRGTRPAARPHRPGGAERAQRGAHLQRRPLLLRHQRHQHQQQDGLAPHGGAGRRGGGGPQLPQVDPARDHHDRRGAGVPDAHAQPLRHHRPDPAERVLARGDPAQDRRQPAARGRGRRRRCKPRILTLTQSTYDGVLYNTETIKHTLDGYIDTLHFDEAWLPHAAFHKFYGSFHAMGKNRARPKDPMVFATQSTHKLLAGISQASQVLVQDAADAQARPPPLQRGLPDAHLHQPAVRDHRQLRRGGGDDGSRPAAPALVEESISEALDFRRAMRKVDEEFGKDWWFKVWGPDELADEGIGQRERLDAEGRRRVARLRRPGRRLQHARPDQVHHHHAGAGRVGQVRQDRHPGRASSPSSWPSTAWWSRRPGLYSFFIMFTIGITKGRWNTLLTALQQFKDDYDRNQPMWRILPEFCAAHPRYERMGLRDLCQSIHEMYAKGDIARLTTEMYLSDLQPAMKPSDAYAHIAHRKTERVEIDELEGRITTALLTPYPPGIPLLIPGERFNKQDRRLPAASRASSTPRSPASTPTCTASSKTKARADARGLLAWTACRSV